MWRIVSINSVSIRIKYQVLLDYFFGREDPDVHEIRVLRPRIGRTDQTLLDYGVESGDKVFLMPDPFPG